MLKALVISNNIEGLHRYYLSNEKIQYDMTEVTGDFGPDLSHYDILVVPNGSDHVAMLKIKDKIKAFLEEGKSLICCDGWFTNWVPGNQWIMDNSKKSIDTRYYLKEDPHRFFEGLDINEFIFSHGISGYWACGYIEPASDAQVLLEDTWQRPIIVLDQSTTRGTIFLTASGPLGDMAYEDTEKINAPTLLFRRLISYLFTQKKQVYA